jgi:hypothetical protein
MQVRSSESGADLGQLSRELAAISHLDISTRKDDPVFPHLCTSPLTTIPPLISHVV